MATTTRAKGDVGPREALLKRVQELKKLQAEAGWFATSHYPDGGPPVAYVASIHEFGYPEGNIPARPFIRISKERYAKGWGVLMGKGVKQVMRNNITAEHMYDMLGLQVAGDIRKTLSTAIFTAISERTAEARAAKRGVDIGAVVRDPLHDTGYMIASLTNQTRERGAE